MPTPDDRLLKPLVDADQLAPAVEVPADWFQDTLAFAERLQGKVTLADWLQTVAVADMRWY